MQIDFTAISGLLYLLSMILYSCFLFFKNKFIGKVASIVCGVGVILHSVAFFNRWYNSYTMYGGGFYKSVPITNLYESLQIFSLLMMVVYLVFEYKSKSKAAGAFATAISGALLLFIDTVGASDVMQPLVPALQSNWLLAHVSLSFIAYVFFAFSAISAFLYLILTSKSKSQVSYVFWTVTVGISTSVLFALIFDGFIAFVNGNKEGFRLFSATINNNLTAVKLMFFFFTVFLVILFWYMGLHIKRLFLALNLDLKKLDDFAYKFAVLGFIIFTIGGLIFGAVWAEQAWGRYWSWDPKETWAFITWVVYGVYLHGRIYGKWSKILSNSIAVIGFILTIFTYLGVNLLLSGLHSYGSL